jgi:tetratricopeptide (TPR) repeat protein
MFPLRKPPKAFRVFCIGGSASAGWPHPAEEIYSAYLRNALQRTYPNRVIEVINVSAHAYAAYRQRLIFQQIIEFQPDLIVIWSGNNEFIERRVYNEHEPWLSTVVAATDRLYLARRIRGSSLGRRLWPENTLLPEERQHVAYEQWSKIEQLALDLRRMPDQYEKVKEHYRFSIQSMVSAARDRAVPVILLTVPVNLRDWHPNVSYQPLEGDRLTLWAQHYRDGRRSLLAGDAKSAVRAFSAATRVSPLHAESQFMLGLAFEQAHEYEAALEAYSQARDLDHNPFRAPSIFNGILRQVAAQYGNVFLVDADRIFRTASAPLAPGFDLFLDYVHPSKRGNRLIAQAVYEKIVERRLVGGEAADITGGPALMAPLSSPKETYDEQRDYAMQGVMVRLFVMMHQYESALDKATALYQSPGAMDALRNGEDAKLIEGVLEVFPKLIEQDRAGLFDGSRDSSTRLQLDSRLKDFYRDNFGGYAEFKSLAPST